MDNTPPTEQLAALGALADPVRRRIYEFVRTSAGPVGRNAVAEALDLPRNAVAFQLDKLAEEGLLEFEFRRVNGLDGPGSGRPAKLYAARFGELAASIPRREYSLAAELMARAIDLSTLADLPVAQALARVSRDEGLRIGTGSGQLAETLERHGYRPRENAQGALELLDCPFHLLSEKHVDTVCSMNLELLGAVIEGSAAPYQACPDTPRREGRCCVRLDPVDAGGPR
ncbi:helix-turn-helix transcriptional regulator [Paeniglutamicibacter cryotolerans]|uniref:Putative ArsR family transcriptional regulator n=1 Tax=Paeniglutamicibacter cryotolerans TaxID=670079 RepID=A0A839QMA9_9MICC|nr:helix-turn-helix domain-containing protein [Paeniglutamicibacter cryotolerans]MBB2994342.1 putative ArsR family transcriptional regulator [Paeniglutamicibacter cryotolerans]